MHDSNIELLTYIHQNAEMGVDTTRHLMGITKDPQFASLLKSQNHEYSMINNISEKKLRARASSPKDLSPLTKAATYLSINLNTLADKNPSHLSEMMIQGSTMGVIDITKKIGAYSLSADKDVIELADSLLSFEQRNIEECKKYLQ